MSARRTSSALRILDRLVGIPALLPFALIPKRREPDWNAVRRIGVLKTAAIGDTLLLATALTGIRRRFPSAKIILVTGENNAPAAALLSHLIDEQTVVSVRSPLSAIRTLRRLELDVLLECGPWPRYDALVTALSGARYRVGFRVGGQARHFAFDRVVEHSSALHQIENLNRLAASVGATDFGTARLPAPNRLSRDRLPAQPFVVLHAWSGGYMGHVKEWPTDRWVELARRLYERSRLQVVVSGGPGDVDRSRDLAAAIVEAGVPATSIAGQFSLLELADVLVASTMVVSVNTGVMHLSALLGATTISLEGPVAVHRWGPVGPSVRSVVTTLPRCGYLDLGFEYAGERIDCMDGVSVDAVVEAIDDVLNGSRAGIVAGHEPKK